jgi:hypothetical protein
MYAIVKNVANPPRISRPYVEPRSVMRKNRSSGPPVPVGGAAAGLVALFCMTASPGPTEGREKDVGAAGKERRHLLCEHTYGTSRADHTWREAVHNQPVANRNFHVEDACVFLRNPRRPIPHNGMQATVAME